MPGSSSSVIPIRTRLHTIPTTTHRFFERPEPINHIDLVPKSPTRSRAGPPATSRRPSGGCCGWLEREHFAYDYYAETQLHDGTLDLDAYKVLIISTHPEYWTRQMYFAVKAWVHKRGGKLMYLGGNGLNCEVEFVDPTTVIYQNGDARAVKQEGYESRFHGRVESEAQLLGVVFSETGIMTAAPFRVLKADHWAFDGTNLKDGDLFGAVEPAHALSGRGLRS